MTGMPLTFDVEGAKRTPSPCRAPIRADLGISLSTTCSRHRNLFSNGGTAQSDGGGIGPGQRQRRTGYNLIAQYVQPWFFQRKPDQTLVVSLSGIKQHLDAYDQIAQTIAAHVRRKFSVLLWTGSVGLSLMHDPGDTGRQDLSLPADPACRLG